MTGLKQQSGGPEGRRAARRKQATADPSAADAQATPDEAGSSTVDRIAGLGDLAGSCLDTFCPLHLQLDAQGRIRHAGPTFRRLRPQAELIGTALFSLLEVTRPQPLATIAELRAQAGRKLHLRFREDPRTALKGVPVAGPDGVTLLNLSFGIAVQEAVRDYGLSAADFAVTDLAIEMLYLLEAKSAAMDASRQLNLRLQGARIAAEEQAFTDTLTGLKNRRAMDHVLERLTAGAEGFGLMHLDLDRFKQVNDTLGHAAGDHVLQQVARVLVEETRGDDTVARVGGDEFVIIFRRVTHPAKLEQAARRMIARLERPIPYGDRLCRISASAGSVLSGSYDDPDGAQMLVDADTALYASKHAGRGRHTVFSPDLRSRGQRHRN